MKLQAVLLIFMIAVQPVQAGFCDMEPSGDAGVHADMQHHVMAESESGHDCCDSEPGEKDSGTSHCDSSAYCGTCVAGLSAAVATGHMLPNWTSGQLFVISTGTLATRHPSPPLRPPIIFS